MDGIDKKIILALFKDGRISQRKIAEDVSLSATSLNYRFNKLIEDGIIKSFKVTINPNFYNKFYAFVSFKNSRDYISPFVNVRVRCLEELNVYRIQGDSYNDLTDKIATMSKELGEPQMTYIPEQVPVKPSGVDIEIVKELMRDPRAEPSDIAKNINIPTKTIQRRISALIGKNIINVIPIVDLSKADIVVFGIFSNLISKLELLEGCKFLSFKDGDRGITVCAVENIKVADSYVKKVREIDNSAEIMIATEYDIYNDSAMKELEDIENKAITSIK
ncbi:winged helix-turn-helix transcriptional regulator [Stygiolobus caldivivus]|uniref:Winged helix-turn-helix domain-containing protein n=1 Tax=Stygiolobus caldivivus TaxID=2824673 RepID=A0A8D5ZKM9_9CREN|nr:winged helix-turn-helix transcriptional regulator [Stygiolobus caldivivus]BCU71447.1 winged helix-turn-helix domain-containing protein [Stygiolobus caldivivus]